MDWMLRTIKPQTGRKKNQIFTFVFVTKCKKSQKSKLNYHNGKNTCAL